MSSPDLLGEAPQQAEVERILSARNSRLLNALILLICVFAALAIGLSVTGYGIDRIRSLTEEAFGARLLSLSVLAAAVILGYFLVLREWLNSSQRLSADLAAAAFEARDSQQWVENERRRRSESATAGSGRSASASDTAQSAPTTQLSADERLARLARDRERFQPVDEIWRGERNELRADEARARDDEAQARRAKGSERPDNPAPRR